MTTPKHKNSYVEGLSDLEIEAPFVDPEEEGLLIDMTEHSGIIGEVLRVELRRARDPAVGRPSYKRKLVESSYAIGLISPEDLPQEGREFRMPYHNLNDVTYFGVIDSGEPVQSVIREEECFFFNTSEGEWRLKILDVGN